MILTDKFILEHLAKGNKIRRGCWQKHLYLRRTTPHGDTSGLQTQKYEIWVDSQNVSHKAYEMWTPSIKQLTATDWECIVMKGGEGINNAV